MTYCGTDCPVLAMISGLSSATSQSIWTPVASTARRVAADTSGPIPSPGMRVTWWGKRLLRRTAPWRQRLELNIASSGVHFADESAVVFDSLVAPQLQGGGQLAALDGEF